MIWASPIWVAFSAGRPSALPPGKLAAGGGGRHGRAAVNPASSAAAPDRSNLDIVVNVARKGLKL
jgi:hypothetical protein